MIREMINVLLYSNNVADVLGCVLLIVCAVFAVGAAIGGAVALFEWIRRLKR